MLDRENTCKMKLTECTTADGGSSSECVSGGAHCCEDRDVCCEGRDGLCEVRVDCCEVRNGEESGPASFAAPHSQRLRLLS